MRDVRKQERVFIKICANNYDEEFDYYSDNNVVERLMEYIVDPRKTESRYTGCFELYPTGSGSYIDDFAKQFYMIQMLNNKFDIQGQPKLIHMIISFPWLGIFDEHNCFLLGQEIARRISGKAQVMFALHEDAIHPGKRGPHIHYIINSVSYVTGEYVSLNTVDFQEFYNIIKISVEAVCPNIYLGGYDYYIESKK